MFGIVRAAALAVAVVVSGLGAVELTVLDEGSPGQLTTLGNLALGQGRYETAIGYYRKALQADRTYLWATYNLGLAYQQLGQLDTAGEWYRKALALAPSQPEVLCNIGWLAWSAGRFQEAAERFEEAARSSAKDPLQAAQYWTNVGAAREGLSQWESAARAYREALALDGRNYNAHYNMATLHLGHLNGLPGAVELAQAHLQQAVEVAPERPEAWLNLAQCHELTGKGDPKVDYEKAFDAATGPYAARRNLVRWQRALWYNRCNPPQTLAMRDELKRLLADDPKYPRANGLYGAYLMAVADYDGAISHLEREVKDEGKAGGKQDSPDADTDLESHYLLAVIYTEHRPDPAKALAHATAYYQRRPDSPKIHELRRRALRLTGGLAAEDEAAKPAGDKPASEKGHGENAEKPAAAADAHGEAHAAPAAHAAAPAHEPEPAASHAAPAHH